MIVLYNGYLKHPNKYPLIQIVVTKEYLKQSGLTLEQLRDKKIKEYYE